jgi:hypothetical protein
MGHIIMNHRVPKYITLDRDKLFTLKFWALLTDLISIKWKLTTAYHLQANR